MYCKFRTLYNLGETAFLQIVVALVSSSLSDQKAPDSIPGADVGFLLSRKLRIQKSRLRWFRQVMRMAEEKIPKKMLHTKMESNDQEEDPEPDGYTKLKRV